MSRNIQAGVGFIPTAGHTLRTSGRWRAQSPAGKWSTARKIASSGSTESGLALLVSAAPIRNRLGKILAGIVIDQDITEQNRSAEELRQTIHLEQKARLDAESASKFKDQFIAMLSHELRTPLTPVVLTLAAMERDPQMPKQFEDDIVMLRRNVGLETKLIDDLLDVTSIANGKFRLNMEPLNIHTLLASVMEIVGGDATAKSQTLNLKLAAQQHTVSGDPVRLHQVFWNILKNAIKFTPDGGTIEIITSNPGQDAVSVEINDYGVGISPAGLPRIFAAFEQADQTTNRRFGGLGIGLTISKAIVDLHGGIIRAESAGEGTGTRFHVQLRTIGPILELPRKVPRRRKPLTSELRLLVVEDHEDTSRVLCRLLRSIGYTVATAASVAAALSYAASNEIDVLLSDIGLPDASGHDSCGN